MSEKGNQGNPYRKGGKFASSGNYDRKIYEPKAKKRVQYASSDERDDALAAQEDIKEKQIKSSAVEAIEKEIEEWKRIQEDPYQSPYLKEQSFKELKKLHLKLDKLKEDK